MKTLKLPQLNQKAEKSGEKEVGVDIFGVEAPPSLLAQAVTGFLSNQRKAHPNAKDRGQVTGSSVKVWRQKGTGRARHGDRQAPIFVGGGKAHGPTGRQNYRKPLNQKMNRKAINAALSLKLKDKKAFLIEEMKFKKTKEAFSFVQKARENLALKGEILLLCGRKEDLGRYFRNLTGIKTLKIDNLNIFPILKAGSLLITPAALDQMTKKEEKNA